VWFGDGGEFGKGEVLAFKLLRRWAAALEEAIHHVRQDISGFARRRGISPSEMTMEDVTPDFVAEFGNEMMFGKIGEFLACKLGHDFDLSEYTAFAELGKNLYWNRIWIMQEFVLAQHLVLPLGHHLVQYDLVAGALEVLEHPEQFCLSKNLQKEQVEAFVAFSSPGVGSLTALRTRWSDREPGTDCSLWELINMNELRESSNPLDAVYGLLDLVRAPEVLVNIDYSMSPVKLFTDLTLNFISHPSVGLNILSLVGTQFNPQCSNRLSMLSWIPQFGRLAGIPIDSGLIFPIAGSVLVCSREQLLL
jgi:hypothetical protein